MANNNLGKFANIKLSDTPNWHKVVDKLTNYLNKLSQQTIQEAFGVVGNRNSLPFSTQILGTIRLVNSGSVAQSYQSWRVKNPTGDISEWIVDNMYQLTPDELKAQKEREKHMQEVCKTATDLFDGLSILGTPTKAQVEVAKDTIVNKYGTEVYDKLIKLLDNE